MIKKEIREKCSQGKTEYSITMWISMVAGTYCMFPEDVIDAISSELNTDEKLDGWCLISGDSENEYRYYFTTTENRVFECTGDSVEVIE